MKQFKTTLIIGIILAIISIVVVSYQYSIKDGGPAGSVEAKEETANPIVERSLLLIDNLS